MVETKKAKSIFERQREREIREMRERWYESYLEDIMLEKAEKEKKE